MFDPTKLHNIYHVARHGKSEANERGIIISNPEIGVLNFGLTEEGRARVRDRAEQAKRDDILNQRTLIFHSDFLRARQTAEIIGDVLGVSEMESTRQLRERSFGKWHGHSARYYPMVWAADWIAPRHRLWGVESVEDVLARMLSLVAQLEDRFHGEIILLVSHGDPLDILRTAFEGASAARHRTRSSFKTAEIVPLGGSRLLK